MKKVVFLRDAFNYDMAKASDETGIDCSVEPSRTKQSFAEECDINTIVNRFGLTGQLPTNVRMPSYQDFEATFDFHTSMNVVAQAGEAFDKMPAHVRARFHNSPQEFLEFAYNEDNRPEAIKLGLVLPKVVELAAGAALPASSSTGSSGTPTVPSDGGVAPPK